MIGCYEATAFRLQGHKEIQEEQVKRNKRFKEGVQTAPPWCGINKPRVNDLQIKVFEMWKLAILQVKFLLFLTVILYPLAPDAHSEPSATNHQKMQSYRRLLPLEGGSNSGDLGGYPTFDGKTVKRGLLFRFAAMTGLTEADQRYLEQFSFSAIMDLRSTEEIDLYPRHWLKNAKIKQLAVPYSILEIMARLTERPADFSKPLVESGNVNLREAAKDNAFAAMMHQYGEEQDMSRPNPLMTTEGVPFLRFTFDAIERHLGSVNLFMTEELGFEDRDLERLRDLYLEP